MKRVLVGLLTFFSLFMSSCEKTQEFPELEDGIEAVVETYFNYEAWCHPDEIAQEGLSYPYKAYRVTEEQKFPETYLKVETEKGETWYCCTYTRWEAYYMNPLRKSLPENLEQVASGEISLPEVTKPVFDETGWKTENIEFTKKNLGYFCARAFEEEYHAGESFEIYLSDFCPENGIMPMMYIICGDEICELRGGMGHHDDWLRADMELTFGMVNDEGLFDTVSKNEISEEKLNHICEIAVLHLEYRKGEEEKEL